jgi:hypothetical protein
MAHACNISQSRRPAKPSLYRVVVQFESNCTTTLYRGPVQCRARAAPFFVTDKPVLSTT